MRVESNIEGIDPQPVLFEHFERVLRHAAGRLSLDLDTIDRVVVVSPDRFGAVVDSISPGATHTNTDMTVAGGKTFVRHLGDRVVSDIVLQCSLFGALAEVLGDPPMSIHWGVDQLQALYVVCHEFGHAQDYAIRNDATEFLDPRSRPFSIRETADYYGNILLTEYAACRNSVAVMTDPLFSHELQEAANRMMEHGKQVNHYLDNPDKLTPRSLAHFVCESAWFNMVELTKLYGNAIGNTERDSAVRLIETELLKGTPLGDTLGRIGTSYPKWDIRGIIPELTCTWHRYAEILNARFVCRDGGPDAMEVIA